MRKRFVFWCGPFIAISFVALALSISGCSSGIPPRITQPLPPPPESSISVPIDISLGTLQDLLTEQARRQPLADGQTPPVNGTLLVTTTVKQIKVKTVRDWVEDKRRNVPSIVGWGLFGPTWGSIEAVDHIPHHEDVFKVIDEGEQFAGEIVDHLTKLIDKNIDVSYIIHYHATFDKIENPQVTGSTFTATFVFNWTLRADLRTPLPVGVTVKGILTATGISAVKATANLSVDDNARLKIAIPDHGVKPEVRSLEIGGIGVNLVPLISLDPSAVLTERTLGLALDNVPLGKVAQGMINEHDADLTFGERIRNELSKQDRPISVGHNVFLDVAPTRLLIGSPQGITRDGKTYLQVPVEVTSPIRVVFADKKPSSYSTTSAKDLPIQKMTEAHRLANLQLVGDVALDKCTAALDTAIKDFWEKQKYLTLQLEPGPTSIWESTDNQFVIEIPIRKQSTKKDFVRLFVWGLPKIVEENISSDPSEPNRKLKELIIENVGWTEKSNQILLNSFAWLARDELRSLLQQNATVPSSASHR